MLEVNVSVEREVTDLQRCDHLDLGKLGLDVGERELDAVLDHAIDGEFVRLGIDLLDRACSTHEHMYTRN